VALTPTYGTPAPLTIDGTATDQLVPVTRQRRRLAALFTSLDAEAWSAPTRCDGWSVRDVAAHLVTVNSFWESSVRSGVSGSPSRVLADFDPVAHPKLLVDSMRALSANDVLERFLASNDGFLAALESLRDDDWNATGESPVGHVSVRLVAYHALWDSWIHERDVAIPLGRPTVVEADEVSACLRYAAAIGPVISLAAGAPDRTRGTFGVAATAPDCTFTLEVQDAVAVRDVAPPATAACLCGDAARLTDALTVRAPLPAEAPPTWLGLSRGLAVAFGQ
jgi:uncharacterized protein (TIGR03083 family)